MKKLIISSFFALGLFAGPAIADTYEGTVSGVSCGHCKKTISQAFSKVEGFNSIRFVDPAKEGELHKLVVETKDGAAVSKETAVAALKDSKYKIQKWGKKDS